MKLTGILLLAAFLHVSARSNAQRLSISVRNGSLERVFSEIEKKTNYVFFYDASVLQRTKPVTVDLKDASVEDVLRISLKGQGLDFTIQDKTIFVKKEKEVDKAVTAALAAAAGNGPITVVVESEAGAPISGATVVIRKLNKSGMTNSSGEFQVKGVPNGEYVVEITNIGFERNVMTLKVADGEGKLAVRMKQSSSGLDEMVVKGYYTTSNRLNTGNVTTVKGEDIQKQPVTDPIQALEGRVPSLNIQQTSGFAGSYAKVQVRGQNSLVNGNDPLYIVDGVPFSSVSLSSTNAPFGPQGASSNPYFNGSGSGLSPFNGLNPADIESIEVLKDADATAIYGSRGANGVILITTKKGKAGDTRFNVNVYTGGASVAHFMDLLNTKQYLAMRREGFANEKIPFPSIITNPKSTDYDVNSFWDTTRYTDWQKVFIGGTANFTNAQADLSGGNSNTQFVLGGGYTRQGTVFAGKYADQKASGHFNLTHSSQDRRFNAQFVTNYVHDNNVLPFNNIVNYIILAPDAPALRDSKGNVNWAPYNGNSTFFSNPVAMSFESNTNTTDNLISNLNLRYQVLPGLDLKSSFGYNHDEMNQSQIIPATAVAPPGNTADRRDYKFATGSFASWIIEPQISYQRTIGSGKLDALVGTSFQESRSRSIAEDASGFPSDALINNPQSAAVHTFYGATDILYRYNAFYGRIGYNWQDKYILNLTARRDGSSRFGPGKQFGNFGAVGAAWIFSKEKFIQDHFSFLSFGKLRGSYGTTGNDQITDYQWLSTYNTPNSTTYQGVTGLAPTRLTNPYFAWEVVKKLEGGLELGLLKDRILLSASYFRNRTGNQLVGLPLPYVTGFGTVQYNLPAIVENTGVELLLTTVNIKSKDFEWSTSVNATLPNNKLVSFPGLANFTQFKYLYSVGRSVYSRLLYHSTGVDPQTGLYTFSTKNANGVPSVQDYVSTKPVTQRFYGGIQNKITYKGVTLDFFFQYVNQTALSYITAFSVPGLYNYNEPTAILGRWQKAGDLTATQRFGNGSSTTSNSLSLLKNSDGVITDASYLRLKNLVVSWQLPAVWKAKVHLQAARIFVQCQNLLTITSYKALDPETPGGLSLPPLRVLTAGIQVGL